MNNIGPLIGSLIFILIFAGCDNQEQADKNLEELYAENGVPVKVTTLKPANFSVNEHFFATLTGIEETTEYAPITDKVEQVLIRVGQRVGKGQVVLTFPQDNPGAQYLQVKENYLNAKATYERMKMVFEKGGISRQDYDNVKTRYEVAKANWNAMSQSVKVQSPISGIITKIDVQPSDNVEQDDPLFTVSKTNKLKASVWVPEKDISNFKVGQKAVAKWNGLQLEGNVTRVNRSMHPHKQAFEMGIEFNNPGLLEQTGVTAEIIIETYNNPEAYAINRRFLIERDSRQWVYLARGDSAVLKPVETGGSNGIDIEIKDGLKSGDKLITEGLLLITDGKKINIRN